MEQLDLFQLTLNPLPKMEHIKLGTFFSGIGAPEKALKKIGIDYELMFFSEIDKYAIQSYCAIHNEDISKNKGDITKIQGKDLPYCDMWFGGFPCQDISLAGKQRGFDKDIRSRSSLGWEMIRLIDEVKEKPKYIVFENVANIMSEKMRPTLNLFKQDLEERGYTLYNEILNAKDYGIPQNRERYFLVAILGQYYFKFPPKQELKLRLKDMLEDEVDEKYYLSDKLLKYMTDMTDRNGFVRGTRFNPHTNNSEYAYAITTNAGNRPTDNFIQIPEATKKGYTEATDGDGVYINRPHQKRGVVQKQMIQTLKTSPDTGVVVNSNIKNINDENGTFSTLGTNCGSSTSAGGGVVKNNLRIRKLSTLECWRLMGFDDSDFEKAAKVCSNSQLYKQAGNSIVVNVLMAIFKELFRVGD